jgi:hypothetical protein
MRRALLCALMAVGLAGPVPDRADAASRHADPDWPCPQRLVASLSPELFWSGPNIAAAGDWRREPGVAALVQEISPRKIAAERGEAAIRAFAERLDEERPRLLTLAFAGILEETNRQRSELIERIRALAVRQRELSDIAVRAGEELRAIPSDASGEPAERRQDLEQRRLYVSRAFEETQRTMRYACETPVQLESRLGVYARALQAYLP